MIVLSEFYDQLTPKSDRHIITITELTVVGSGVGHYCLPGEILWPSFAGLDF
jgi:hypothetical protein